MGRWRWLSFGLHLKRYVFLICLGIFLLILGAMAVGVGLFMVGSARANLPVNPYGLGGLLIVLGGTLITVGVYRLMRRIEKLLKRRDEPRGLAELAYLHNRLEQGPRIVCLGGGTGLSTLLSGLRDYSSAITAIVSVADDGGSSGRLRHDFDILPPGDIRNCLIALADSGPVMAELMQYRFEEGELSGHAFGNLFITVLARIRGNFGLAVREANRILNVRGQVLPATLERAMLVATHPDGSKTTGQRLIARCGKEIAELSLKPAPGQPPEDVLENIGNADLIVIGPGSVYTSILPNLLSEMTVKAISQSRAKVVYVLNTMGQVGETADFSASDHVNTILRHAPGLRIDSVIINQYRPSPARLEPLEARGARLVEYDREELARFRMRVLLRDVIHLDDPRRHDPAKLAAAVMEAYQPD